MKFLIIKCGGSIIDKLPDNFYDNIAAIQKQGDWKPIIVHGGGKLINELLQQTGVKAEFIDGLRVTTEEVLDVVEMALSGAMNKFLVRKLMSRTSAYGISGLDGKLLYAEPVANAAKLGLVGTVTKVNTALIEQIVEQDNIPVISPLAGGEDDARFNINADLAASAIARALQAELCFISDIPGIYRQVDGEKQMLTNVTDDELKQMIQQGLIKDGMIPKVQAALEALKQGAEKVTIVNGLAENSLLQLVDGNVEGTTITLSEEAYHV
ncbi:N-acetylglutamate kinase [Terribacillus aidingensis]|uniref:Acetylglutamate kinase n=1 Tax=Terribacillus aidingensis TaxID=586416 RepID=A0A285N545_9BACI|nr:acetylglutamate kinase [Terribacillus aidingensis]SNZ04063.1 N-acetylglutamate kinase [Terribacillus aidingensis]